MSITPYPNGISSFGIPLYGTQGFEGWWGRTAYFVDNDLGSDGNTGKQPTKAFLNLKKALDTAIAGDVIYIRPKDLTLTDTDPTYIVPATAANWSIAEAQHDLAIIGAQNMSHIPGLEPASYAVYLRGHTSVTGSPVLTVQGARVVLENLAFHRGGITSAVAQVKLDGNSTSIRAFGSVVYNCLFRMHNVAAGAVYNVDNWHCAVVNSTFHDCKIGVEFYGSSSTPKRFEVMGCTFINQSAAQVDQNIYIHGSGGAALRIHGCRFTDAVPAAGTNKYINIASAATGLISGCYFFGDGNSNITNNGVDVVGSFDVSTNTTGLFGKT